MKQKAKVLEIQGENALVSVRRSSMCEGCEKQGGCGSACTAGELLGASKTMTVLASNDIGAKAGDTVVVETESTTVLRYAALVFLFPIALLNLFCFVGIALGMEETSAMLFGLVLGLVLSFLVVGMIDRIKRKKGKPVIRITAILE